jgi:hypothetical protein
MTSGHINTCLALSYEYHWKTNLKPTIKNDYFYGDSIILCTAVTCKFMKFFNLKSRTKCTDKKFSSTYFSVQSIDYGLDDRGIRVWFLAWPEIILFSITFTLTLDPTQPRIQWLLGVQQLGHEDDHSPSTAKAKNAWRSPPPSLYHGAYFKTGSSLTLSLIKNANLKSLTLKI